MKLPPTSKITYGFVTKSLLLLLFALSCVVVDLSLQTMALTQLALLILIVYIALCVVYFSVDSLSTNFKNDSSLDEE